LLLFRVGYQKLAHFFNSGADELNCFLSKEKTHDQWTEDKLKTNHTGFVLTAAICKEKVTEMNGYLSVALNNMRR
jgi:hypothetical protein